MGLPLLRPRMGMLASGPPLSPPRRLYFSEPNRFKSKVENKLQHFNAMKNKAKLYLSEALRASASYIKKIAQKILDTVKELAHHSAHEVAMGFKAHVSQSYFYCFLLGVGAIVLWFSEALNLLKPSSTEGDDSGVDKWDARLKDLLKEFPQKIALGVLYMEFAVMVLKEIIIARKQLTVDLLKRLEAMNEMIHELKADLLKRLEALNEIIQELKAENSVIKADLVETQKMLKDMGSQVDELREAISKTTKSSE